MPEAAVNVPLTREKVEGAAQPAPGGTPFTCEKLTVRVEEGLSLPLSALNALRRRCWTSWARPGPACRSAGGESTTPASGMRIPGRPRPLTVSVRSGEQVTRELLALGPARLYLPCDEGAACPDVVRPLSGRGGGAGGPAAPGVLGPRELPQLLRELETLKGLGVREAMAGTLDGVRGRWNWASSPGATLDWACTTARP